MGPVASLAQRQEVRAAVARLEGAAQIVFGDPTHVEASGADVERGAFVSPVLLRGNDIKAPALHEVEAFGPVSTLLPYSDIDDVIAAAALGGGSLVGSVVAHDRAVAMKLIAGLAPWHGRVLSLDRDNAGDATPHGVGMPQLLHGGPGRAGGGEELGGLRALTHYMQRTAVQGHPDLIGGLPGVEGEST